MTMSRASSMAGEAGWEHDRSCRRLAHRMRPRSGTLKGPGRHRFLFLAPQGDTPMRSTHCRVGDSQCQFGSTRDPRDYRGTQAFLTSLLLPIHVHVTLVTEGGMGCGLSTARAGTQINLFFVDASPGPPPQQAQNPSKPAPLCSCGGGGGFSQQLASAIFPPPLLESLDVVGIKTHEPTSNRRGAFFSYGVFI